MPLSTQVPTAVGTFDQWSLFAGADRVTAVQTDDGLTSYLRCDAFAGPNQSWAVQDLPAWARIVQKVQTVFSMSGGTASDFNAFIRYNGTNSSFSVHTPSTNFALFTDTWDPPGGGNWTPAIDNATEVCLNASPSDEGANCTYASLRTTWQATPGFFSFCIPLLLGGAVGAAVGLHELPAIAREIHRLTRGRLRILPEEYREACEELRAPRRRYAA